MRVRSLHVLILILFFAGWNSVHALESMALEDEKSERQFAVSGGTSFGGLNSELGTVYALFLNFGGELVMSQKYGVGLMFSQGFQTSGLSPLMSMISFSGTYALGSSLTSGAKKIKLGETTVVTTDELYSGGFRAKAFINQLFYNGERQVTAFAGPGAGLEYETPSQTRSNWNFGVRVDYVSNGSITLLLWRTSVGYSFRY